MLRFVIAISAAALIAGAGLAQDRSETAETPLEFADDAQGGIAPPIMGILGKADSDGKDIEQRIKIQGPNSFGFNPDLDELRDRALNNTRVRALLDADGGTSGSEATEARYGNDRILLFASFSMPPQALRSLMIEAQRFEVPIIMRGFVNNSAVDTQTALQKVFGDDAQSVGFGIDPTLFTRFGVNNVPQVIVVDSILGPCETQACLNDIVPEHDVVRGNIPVEAALRVIANGDGVGAKVAAAALGENL